MTWREWIIGWTARYWQLRTAAFLREPFKDDAGYCLDQIIRQHPNSHPKGNR